MVASPELATITAPSALTQRLLEVQASPATPSDIDLYAETAAVLQPLGLSLDDFGGALSFYGSDPIVPSRLRFGSSAAIALAAKAVAIATIWRERSGEAQDIRVDVRKALRRFTAFVGGYYVYVNGQFQAVRDPLELLNGQRGTMEAMGPNPFLTHPYLLATGDGRHVMPMNVYPGLLANALRLLGCDNSPEAVKDALRTWTAPDLEAAGAEAGVVMAMARSLPEFMQEQQYTEVLADLPLVVVERISDSEPRPWNTGAITPLQGIRALGLGHVIAGAAIGRALALHGADVLNIWQPWEYEHDSFYYTANVGMRSSTLSLEDAPNRERFDALLGGADIFFANRRLGYLERQGLSAAELAERHPGIIHVQVTGHGDRGPWANRPAFDVTAGAVSGVNVFEGTVEEPRLPPIVVVNDFVVGWLATVGVLSALRRRAVEGGSYRVSVSLTRGALWLYSLGILDKEYALATAGSVPEHTPVRPDMFLAETPAGRYQGVTEQVEMSRTPGFYQVPFVARGSSSPTWLWT